MPRFCVARQAIFDRELEVQAYELLYRACDCAVPVSDGDGATSQVILNGLQDIGLERLVGRHRAFINLTRHFLVQPDIPLPRDKVVLEILEDIEPDATVMQGVRALGERGYTLALDDFIYAPGLEPLIEQADIIKIDIQLLPRQQLEAQVRRLRTYPVQLLAEKVETEEELDRCRALGFDYFQGFFLARPHLVRGRTLSPSRQAALDLLSRLQDPELDMDGVARLIEADPGLGYRLVRFVNSAGMGLTRLVDSIRQAAVYVGTEALRGLASLMVLAGENDRPRELLRNAVLRGRLCENIARKAGLEQPESHFTVGMFSLLDALLGKPLPELLERLTLTPEVHQALLDNRGERGEVLRAARAYEAGDWSRAACAGLDAEAIADLYLEALAWTDQAVGTT